jgi:hypothetical protein
VKNETEATNRSQKQRRMSFQRQAQYIIMNEAFLLVADHLALEVSIFWRFTLQ